MFQHGRLNSRMKDYFDIGLLAGAFDFDAARLARAILATFQRRGTALVVAPVGLSDEFATEPGKQTQWGAFLRKIQVIDAHGDLATQVKAVRAFLDPVLAALVDGVQFAKQWPKGGPWE